MRLFVSGSAALPAPLLRRWEEISGGHRLLERYGMTECMMALSNPLSPTSQRLEGHVGLPLPSVRARIVDETTGRDVTSDGTSGGELRLKGDTLFMEYWNRPEETAASFDADGWFKTGDVAIRNLDNSIPDKPFKILGRRSVDIIKSGGFKISALEVERGLLGHDRIAEAVIVGIPDETLGEVVAAVLVFKNEEPRAGLNPSLEELRVWAADFCADYKFPRIMVAVDDIPKNAMGKVNKKELLSLFEISQ